MENNKNIKKLLCNNVVNGYKCAYRNRCMFAHDLSEQKVDDIREVVIKMITGHDNLSCVDIYNNKQLFSDMIILTKECKNCVSGKCTGGYNCKFGTCKKSIKICHEDLVCGKCQNEINDDYYCSAGIHLTEKKLIPYNQRHNIEVSIKGPTSFASSKINYNNKINAISMILTDETIDIADGILKGKINDEDIIINNRIIYDQFINDNKMSNIENLIKKNMEERSIERNENPWKKVCTGTDKTIYPNKIDNDDDDDSDEEFMSKLNNNMNIEENNG